MENQIPLDRTQINNSQDREESLALIQNNAKILELLNSKKSTEELWEKEPVIQEFFKNYDNLQHWRIWNHSHQMAEKERRGRESGKIVPIKKTNDYIEHRGYPFSTYTPITVNGFLKSAAQVSLASGGAIGAIAAIIAAIAGAPEAAATAASISVASLLGLATYPISKVLASLCSERTVDSYGSTLNGFWDKARFKIRKFFTLAFGTATLALSLFTFLFQPYNAEVQVQDDMMISNFAATEVFADDLAQAKNETFAAFEKDEISFAEYEQKLEFINSSDFKKESFLKHATADEVAKYEKAVEKAEKTNNIATSTAALTAGALIAQPFQSETLKDLES